MKSFNVLWWDFNKTKPEQYDVIPYLVRCYHEASDKPTTFDEFKEFIRLHSLSQWWARCEYEMIVTDWPCERKRAKVDIHQQLMMNIDLVTEIVINEVLNGVQAEKLSK